eukprot:g9360.t1
MCRGGCNRNGSAASCELDEEWMTTICRSDSGVAASSTGETDGSGLFLGDCNLSGSDVPGANLDSRIWCAGCGTAKVRTPGRLLGLLLPPAAFSESRSPTLGFADAGCPRSAAEERLLADALLRASGFSAGSACPSPKSVLRSKYGTGASFFAISSPYLRGPYQMRSQVLSSEISSPGGDACKVRASRFWISRASLSMRLSSGLFGVREPPLKAPTPSPAAGGSRFVELVALLVPTFTLVFAFGKMADVAAVDRSSCFACTFKTTRFLLLSGESFASSRDFPLAFDGVSGSIFASLAAEDGPKTLDTALSFDARTLSRDSDLIVDVSSEHSSSTDST